MFDSVNLIDSTPLVFLCTLANERLFIPVRGQLDSSLRLYSYQAVQGARQIHRQPTGSSNKAMAGLWQGVNSLTLHQTLSSRPRQGCMRQRPGFRRKSARTDDEHSCITVLPTRFAWPANLVLHSIMILHSIMTLLEPNLVNYSICSDNMVKFPAYTLAAGRVV
jgi:hypothetical protein